MRDLDRKTSALMKGSTRLHHTAQDTQTANKRRLLDLRVVWRSGELLQSNNVLESAWDIPQRTTTKRLHGLKASRVPSFKNDTGPNNEEFWGSNAEKRPENDGKLCDKAFANYHEQDLLVPMQNDEGRFEHVLFGDR
ncbi:hypothetical protein BYT27DRAFT_7259927 [Phlegmacium glaucopus]|nr:hypothetical protein BYT27DRAFT_7259927 [Phlegmacium glaucopus]